MDEPGYTSVEEQVEYGLEAVAADRTVEVPLRDLLYVYKTLGELISFFHQPLHYPDLAAVEEFLGDRKRGAYHLFSECYYRRLRDVWPEDIAAALEEGGFSHPRSPYFYHPTDEAPLTDSNDD